MFSEAIAFAMPDKSAGKFIGEIVDVSNADHLKKLSFDLKPLLGENYMVVLCANIAGKAAVSILLSDSMVTVKGLEAPKLIKEQVAPLIKGGGGGQKLWPLRVGKMLRIWER